MTEEEQKKYDAAISIIETCKKAFEDLGAGDMPKILEDALVRLKPNQTAALDFDKAIEHLTDVRNQFSAIGVAGIPALNMTINPLLIRFERGERTEDLYNNIMALEL